MNHWTPAAALSLHRIGAPLYNSTKSWEQVVADDARRAGGYLSLDDDALLQQCEVDHYRSGGPGGQKRNKTSSAVRLRHQPTGLIVTASDERQQKVNLIRAIRRLREAIALNVRTRVELSRYAPSPLLSECVGAGAFLVSDRDPRYFRAVQEIVDVVYACGMAVGEAADLLGLSTAHLVKLLHADPKVWERVNQLRTASGLTPLR